MNKKKTPAEKLQEKLIRIEFISAPSEIKKKQFNTKEFKKIDQEVKKTFSDEDLARFNYF